MNSLKKIILSLAFLAITVGSYAQSGKYQISGQIIDKELNEELDRVAVQLYTLPDSTYIKGVSTDLNGRFSFSDLKPSSYVVKVSFLGYKTLYKSIAKSALKPKTNLGKLELETDAIMLEAAEITAEAPQVTVSEDTLVYNASAYRVSNNAMLEELVKKLPGAQVDEDGKITINGQEIKKIMVDGKEFFTQDPDIAMKNLPVDIIDKVKSYNKKSDKTRITGIDDGNEETVLDLTVKKGKNQGWFGNLDVGAGNHDRYTAKGLLNRFADGDQYTGIVNFNNVRDASVGGRRWSGGGGMRETKSGGLNMSITRKKFELGGSVDYRDNERDTQTKTSSETFLQQGSSYSSGYSNSINRNRNFSTNFRMEWKPDSMTNIMFFPRFSYSKSKSHSDGESKTGDVDNFENWESMLTDGLAINKRTSYANSHGDNISFGANLMFNRRLSKAGRNIGFNVDYGYGEGKTDGTDYSLIEYYKENMSDRNEERDLLTKNNNDNYNYRLEFNYSEPIFTNRFLQFSYNYNKSYNKSDRRSYRVENFEEGDDLQDYFDADLSKLARNYYDNHEISVKFNTIREKYNYNVGFTVQPQRNKLTYDQSNRQIDTVRTVVNFTPTFDFRYQFNKQSNLRIVYRGNTQQPNIMDMIPIRDVTNPLNIREGNPGLKPGYVNSFMTFYNTYFAKSQRSIFAHVYFRNTLNSVSSKVVYDTETGGKTTRPENINGNWSTGGSFNFSTPFKNKKFTMSTYSSANFNNIVGYMSLDSKKDAEKNNTRNLRLVENLTFNFRNDWFEMGTTAGINYSRVSNTMQKQSNRETFDYNFGLNSNIQLPWDLSFSTDGNLGIKSGYSQGLDRNEFVWNIQLAKDFLKKKQATISVQVFDVLKQRTNLSRSISASMSQDTEYNEITSFFMVHFIYKLNTFGGGGKDSRGQGHGRGSRRGPGGGPRSVRMY